MFLMYTRLALGVDGSGDGLNLVALGRRFRNLVVVDWLHLPDPRGEGSRRKVAEFLDRSRIREARVTACIPRADLLVRFMDLPAEAERQLAKVIGYQIDVLHPFQDAQVYWDCAVVGREAKTKQIRVMVVLIEKSRLDRHYQVLTGLGLRVDSLTLAAASLSPLLKPLIPETALVVCGRPWGVELLGFYEGNLCATRALPAEPRESATERFERELHSLRSVLPLPDPTTLPLFTLGPVAPAFSGLVSGATAITASKLPLAMPPGFDPGAEFPALAAAYVGLQRKPVPWINLLPPEQRWRPKRWVRVPIYALGTTAALLAMVVTAHGWIENEFYGRALTQQIERLASRASQVRQRSQRESALAARAEILTGVRDETWHKIQLLQELTRLLPDDTWAQEVQLGEETIELYGYSNRAADLVQPLENSRYFSQVEFTSPITRDAQNKEIFRMRMRLEQPTRP